MYWVFYFPANYDQFIGRHKEKTGYYRCTNIHVSWYCQFKEEKTRDNCISYVGNPFYN